MGRTVGQYLSHFFGGSCFAYTCLPNEFTRFFLVSTPHNYRRTEKNPGKKQKGLGEKGGLKKNPNFLRINQVTGNTTHTLTKLLVTLNCTLWLTYSR